MWHTLGQNRAVALLQRELQANTISQAYLITGPENIGKNTLAMDFAMALNCEGDSPPCGQCHQCRRILKNLHADIIYLSRKVSLVKDEAEFRGSSEISIEDMRRIQQLIPLAPYEGRYKVFIIDGADQISHEGANCILKTLEELLPHVVVMLLAVDEEKVLQTIVSRCTRIKLEPLTTSAIENHLVNALAVDMEKARNIARLAAGRLGFAISIANDESILEQYNQTMLDLMRLMQCGPDQRFSFIADVDRGYRGIALRQHAESLINSCLSLWHDILLAKSGSIGNIQNLWFSGEIKDCASLLNLHQIRDFIKELQVSLVLIAKNANIRLALEVLMLHMPYISGSGAEQSP